MPLRSLGFAPLFLCLCLLRAQDTPVAPVPPAAQSDPTVKPGALWGTVISRDQFRPLNGKERWNLYWRQSYWRPGAFFGNAFPALDGHLDNDPPEWGQGVEGYSKRFANRFARSAIRDSINAAGSATLGYDVRYVRCDCKRVLPRVGHALIWNFLTLNRNGKTVVNLPRIGGSFAGEFIGRTWMPPGYNTAGDALRSGGIQLGWNSLFNVIREFAPRRDRR